PRAALCPYTTLFRSRLRRGLLVARGGVPGPLARATDPRVATSSQQGESCNQGEDDHEPVADRDGGRRRAGGAGAAHGVRGDAPADRGGAVERAPAHAPRG